jgi:excisionase family DNA binding protein
MTGLPLDKAAEILGKSPRTVLRWIHAGKIPATKVDGEWQVDVSDVRPNGRTDVTAEMAAEILDLKDEIAFLKSQVTEKDKQISELHVIIARTQPQLEGPGHRRWWSSLMFWKR